MVCSICKQVAKGYNRCTVCDQKLCPECLQKNGHVHETKYSEDPPFKCYIRKFLQVYRNQESDTLVNHAYAHVLITKLICECSLCKQFCHVYDYQPKKCFAPNCHLTSCLGIHDSEFNYQDLEQKIFKMKNLNQNVGPTSINAILARKFTIQRCIRTLVHACHCLETDCMPVSCQKMKRILAHIKVCKRKVQGGCTICTQLSTLCCFHAKNCKEVKCPVLLCSAYKRKLGVLSKKARVA